MNTKIQSQKKAKLSILGKRKASSELPSQESSAHGITPPVIGPTTSSVEAILPLTVVDGPPRPSKGKEAAITPTIDTDGALETLRSKQVLIKQDVAVEFPRMIRVCLPFFFFFLRLSRLCIFPLLISIRHFCAEPMPCGG